MALARKLRPLQRVDLVRNIAADLENKYSYTDFDTLVVQLGLTKKPDRWSGLEDYMKKTLSGCTDEQLLGLAEELAIDTDAISASVADPPAIWRDGSGFRLFISHISQKKAEAHRLREALSSFGISGFVAHDDIEPTADWQREIERALKTADAFLAIVAEGFSQSPWTQQEIGFALARRVKVMTFKLDGKEDPKGFIARAQSLARDGRNAQQIAQLINDLLLADVATRDHLKAQQERLGAPSEEETPF